MLLENNRKFQNINMYETKTYLSQNNGSRQKRS